MSQWNELDDKGKAEALAKLLGWHYKDVSFVQHDTHLTTYLAHWEDAAGEIKAGKDFNPVNDWRSMGLVVEAMAEKGYAREVAHFTFGRVIATFYDNDGKAFTAEANDHNEPAAVALAALRALGGEQGATDS